MPRRKSQRLAELSAMPHVFLEPETSPTLRSFAGQKPLVLDLGCGRGDTTVAMATADPSRHYLGVDLKGARLHRGAEAALKSGLTNVAFAVFSILHLERALPKPRGVEAWIFFPDPFLKTRAAKHRLTSPAYLRAYRRLLQEGATVHLKTDSLFMFEYTLRTLGREGCVLLDSVPDLPTPKEGEVQSAYESKFRREGRAIHYLSFQVH
jgi:tRNA (guanine-N7-)-methyltransferase